MFKANVTVLLLVLINNVNISRLNRIGRQLQPVELAAGELAVNWQTTSAWYTNTIILLERYCGTITEPGLPVAMSDRLNMHNSFNSSISPFGEFSTP